MLVSQLKLVEPSNILNIWSHYVKFQFGHASNWGTLQKRTKQALKTYQNHLTGKGTILYYPSRPTTIQNLIRGSLIKRGHPLITLREKWSRYIFLNWDINHSQWPQEWFRIIFYSQLGEPSTKDRSPKSEKDRSQRPKSFQSCISVGARYFSMLLRRGRVIWVHHDVLVQWEIKKVGGSWRRLQLVN